MNRLVKLVAEIGKNWDKIAENLPGRSADECREQYEAADAERDDERMADEEDDDDNPNDRQ